MNWIEFLAPFAIITFVTAGILEMVQPLTPSRLPFSRRWSFHVGLWLFICFIFSLTFRTGSALYASTLTTFCPGLLFFLIYDFCLWLLHVTFHRVGWLWIWHATHHSDPEMDASTGFRFHPMEAVADQSVLFALIYLLHPPFAAVLAIQYTSIALTFFAHSNATFPPRLEKLLSYVFTTPSIHRNHHAKNMEAQNSNFGLVFSFWDRIFSTYRAPLVNPVVGIDGPADNDTFHPVHALITIPWKEWQSIRAAEPAPAPLPRTNWNPR